MSATASRHVYCITHMILLFLFCLDAVSKQHTHIIYPNLKYLVATDFVAAAVDVLHAAFLCVNTF